jgi:hypothetical protein
VLTVHIAGRYRLAHGGIFHFACPARNFALDCARAACYCPLVVNEEVPAMLIAYRLRPGSRARTWCGSFTWYPAGRADVPTALTRTDCIWYVPGTEQDFEEVYTISEAEEGCYEPLEG